MEGHWKGRLKLIIEFIYDKALRCQKGKNISEFTWFVTKEDNRYGIQTMIPTLEMEVYNSNHSYHGW